MKSILRQREEERKHQQEELRTKLEEKKKQIKEKAELYRLLKNAITEIMRIDHNNLESTPQKAHDGFMPPKDIRPLQVFKENIQRMNTLEQLQILNIRTQIEKGTNANVIPSSQNPIIETATVNQSQRQFFTGVGQFLPSSNLSTQFRFRVGTEKLLSEETTTILKELAVIKRKK